MATIFTRWLDLLGVPHTAAYSDEAYAGMTFHTLFGLSKLLQSYGIDTRGIRVADTASFAAIPPPYAAQLTDGTVALIDSVPDASFASRWTGVALLAVPRAGAAEPGYRRHRFREIMTRLRDIGLWVSLAAIFVYFFIAHGLEGRWSTVVLAALDIGGILLSFMLVQKTAGVHTGIGDRVCGVLEKGGCDDILATRASTFLGIFHWSEVGLAYFGVSLLTLLLFPDRIADLALINACCLPYTVWSITYQRFVAHRWCTMCVGVQATLWLLFFTYLAGGCFHGSWPPHLSFFALGAVYIAALLFFNKYSHLLRYAYDTSRTSSSLADTPR